MQMGQQVAQDPRAVARGEAQAKLAQALVDLKSANEILASIESIVGAREEAHRTAAAWMSAMATQARNAVATRSLDRLMTPEWLQQLSVIGDRHDTAAARLQEALEERAKAVAAHQRVAARMRALRAEVARLGPTAALPVRPVQTPYPPYTQPYPVQPYPYYQSQVSPFSSIALWAR
jgi:hypothetical protein